MEVILKCRATKPYKKKDAGELDLNIGDVVNILRQGRSIWYGQIKDKKGFFPCDNVELIEEHTSETKSENPLSPTTIDKENSKVTVEQSDTSKPSMDPKTPNDSFQEIESTTPLEDKRRLRAKSTGRPPSQVFIKENILQRSASTEDLDIQSDDESQDTNENESNGAPNISSKMSFSQLVVELKQKPHLKTVIQKETINTTTSTEDSPAIPAWMKAIKKKISSTPNIPKKSDEVDNTPPWMKEMRQKREHKLSLRGDEVLPKASQEIQVYQNGSTNQAKIEVQAYETRTSNHTVAEEKHNIQTKSVKMETREVYSNKSDFLVESKRTIRYSFTEENSDANVSTASIKKIEVSSNTEKIPPKEKHVSLETKAIEPNIKVESIETATNNKEVSSNAMIRTKPCEIVLNTETLTSIDTLDKIKPSTITPSSEKSPVTKSPVTKSVTFKDVDDNIKKEETETISEEIQILPTSLNESDSNYKNKICESTKLILQKIEDFQRKSAVQSKELHKQIHALQLAIDHQYEEVATFIKEIKSELSVFAEEKS